jgi:acyl-CoA reductase-like NAD-dependent aldehyde dehydrogenase
MVCTVPFGGADDDARLSLECGGNAPVIVMPDADMDLVTSNAGMAKCRNVGQVCVSPQRFLVHAKVQDEFLEKVVPQFRTLKVGNGANAETQVGPLINARQQDRVEELVAAASATGAEILAGGSRPAGMVKGYFFEPTVVGNVSPEKTGYSARKSLARCCRSRRLMISIR